jgi:hypothetical protein
MVLPVVLPVGGRQLQREIVRQLRPDDPRVLLPLRNHLYKDPHERRLVEQLSGLLLRFRVLGGAGGFRVFLGFGRSGVRLPVRFRLSWKLPGVLWGLLGGLGLGGWVSGRVRGN